jgi:hypothetical protein
VQLYRKNMERLVPPETVQNLIEAFCSHIANVSQRSQTNKSRHHGCRGGAKRTFSASLTMAPSSLT